MELTGAIAALSALAQPSRLSIFRLLVKAGTNEVAAGEIAAALDIPPSTLSAHLSILAHAGLVQSRRESRTILYRVDLETMTTLMAFLIEDCCDGRAELCRPLKGVVKRAASCGRAAGARQG
jgi:DNA-binding transcriptional ArsR family regulator